MSQTELPSNASHLERALYHGWKTVLAELESPYPTVKDPKKCPSAFLSLLAGERGVLDWLSSDNDVDKRLTVNNAFNVHQMAGTREGIIQSIETLDASAVIKKSDKPYQLDVDVVLKNKPLTTEVKQRIQRRVDTYKSERDTINLSYHRPSETDRYKAAVVQWAKVITFEAE